ncbi:MAG: D-alanyl-D-alanine carboxypeptidase family protein [Sporomusaceae bacterium]|nr:D-alanyl-D-alanine carboxypeptidase family protein [Sporomusaceae bacterium]
MQRILSICGGLLLAVLSLAAPAISEAAYLLPPPVEAKAAIVIDADTKAVLYEKSPDKRMYPASTTKIMTFMLARKLGLPQTTVTVSSSAAGCEGSSLELRQGDRIGLQDLLYGLMLVSGNDAAEAVAEHISGSVPAFVRQMNAEAAAIGARNTHFVNPHGLPDSQHYTTARDLALITAQALQDPEFSRVAGAATATIQMAGGKTRQISNTNKLLTRYSGMNAGKTGYTRAAGDCLVATAKRDGVQLIVVVLNDDDRWTDAARLLDFGFAQRGLAG